MRTLNIIIFYLFVYKMNQGDLPLMYSCDFWWEFIDLVVLLAVMVLPLCNSLQVLQGSHNKKTTKSMNSHQKNTGIHQR